MCLALNVLNEHSDGHSARGKRNGRHSLFLLIIKKRSEWKEGSKAIEEEENREEREKICMGVEGLRKEKK